MKSTFEKVAQACHIVSAIWVVVLALIIFIDVSGRFFLNMPLLGAAEVIKNSVVSITFLQLPLAIYRGGMIKTTLVYDIVNSTGKKIIRSSTNVLGLCLFLGIAYSSWQPFVEAWQIGEYEGEGALRVPTYPVRFLVVITSAFSALVYLYLLYLDWTGQLELEEDEVLGI